MDLCKERDYTFVMDVKEIRRATRARPFRPIELRLQDGERLVVRHPEAILVAEDLVMMVDRRGQAILIAPEAVVSIRRSGTRSSSGT
jgi:hypothetical protein